ncbi:MAG: SPFH domain-containing protein [Clostridia bacterium]
MAIVKVVKYNGNSDVFVWKYPSEELGTWTQLIVNESQEAILFKGGQALDLFTAGRHTLDTANIPILNNVINLPFGGHSPFTAEVWYINKIHSLDIKWGTASPIQLQDPKFNVFIPLRSFGQFGIKVSDSRKFLMKLIGTLPTFTKDDVIKYFKGIYLTKVKDTISSYLINKKISILEINAYLDELSEFLKERMSPIFEEYGITLVNFYVNDINVPEDDTAVIKLKDALAKKAEMDIVGFSYTQERSFDTLEGAAKNTGGGQSGLMGAGIGLGMGVGVGGAFGGAMGDITESMNTRETKKCSKCGTEISLDKRFCSNCGADSLEPKQEQEVKSENTITCSNCNSKFAKGVKFCPECGNLYNPCAFCGADIKEGADKCPSCGKSAPKPCPKCGKLNSDSEKFCSECGESLVKKCGNCGVVIKDNPKFCPECGSKL